jgi:hypothetical protein
VGNILTSWAAIIFSRTLLHGVGQVLCKILTLVSMLNIIYPYILLKARKKILWSIDLTHNNAFGTTGSMFAKFEISWNCHCFKDSEMRHQPVILHDVTRHLPEMTQLAFLPIYKQCSAKMWCSLKQKTSTLQIFAIWIHYILIQVFQATIVVTRGAEYSPRNWQVFIYSKNLLLLYMTSNNPSLGPVQYKFTSSK